MARDDETADLIAAFLIGATLGIGATLLLRSDTRSETQRLLREIGALPKRGKPGATRLADAGREAVATLRDELAGMVDSARDEVSRAAREAVREARHAVRRRGRG